MMGIKLWRWPNVSTRIRHLRTAIGREERKERFPKEARQG